MYKAAKSKSAKKRIAKFRLEVSRVILGNLLHMARPTGDIEHIANIAELCEQYSLLIVLNWLATRYGLPLCKTSIFQDIDCKRFPLLSWALLANRYPLQLHHDCREFISACADLCSYLDDTFDSEIELAGDIHQQIISSPLRLNDQGNFYIELQSDDRSKGEFYTPAWVADIAINDWIDYSVSNLLDSWRENELDKLALIFDPACGSGNFLHAAMRRYIDNVSEPGRLFLLAGNTLFGADLDGRAIELAKLSLLILLSPALNKLAVAERETAIGRLMDDLDKHITQTDSLLSFCAENPQKGFDLIVSNPPYISFGSRDQAQINPAWQRYLKARFPASSEYKLRFTSLFQEIGIDLTAHKDGQSIFLVPDAFLTGSYYQKLRNLILEKVEIIALTELPTDTIYGATVGRWCLAHYRKKSGARSARGSSGIAGVPPASSKDPTIILKSLLDRDKESEKFFIPQSMLVSKDRQRFQLLFSNTDLEIVKQCSSFNWLGSQLKGHTGIRSRLGQAAIIAKEKKSDKFHAGIISGAQVRPFSIEWRGDWLEITSEKLFAGGFDKKVICGPKVLLRQTGDSLIAAVDKSGLYHLNNVHSFLPLNGDERDWRAYYFCCLLNSEFYRYFYRLKTREHKRALAQIDIETVEHMPLPESNRRIELELSRIGQLLSESAEPSLLLEMNRLVFEMFNLEKVCIAQIKNSLAAQDGNAVPELSGTCAIF